MTNKTERYFVCSESELKRLLKTHARFQSHNSDYDGREEYDEKETEFEEAEAACRAREVEPLDVTEWPDKTVQTWVGEVKK